MLIRKFVIAGFVLAAVGLTVTVTTGVIGQQPGTVEKNDGAVAKTVPAAGTTKSVTDEFSGTAPPAAEDSRLSRGQEGAEEGTAADPAGAGAGGGVAAPAAGSGSPAGAPPGKAKGSNRSSAKTPRSGSARSGGGMIPGMPRMPGMPGMGGMPPGGGGMPVGMMPGMIGGGMPVPVPEDEHLESWVNQALADYAQTEDQAARKQQRELIAKALDQIFDIRQERRMGELETLEQRVQKLRGTLETREKLKSDILKNRLDYLIREADGLGWGDGLPAPGRSAPTGMGPPGGGGGSPGAGAGGGSPSGAGGGGAAGGSLMGRSPMGGGSSSSKKPATGGTASGGGLPRSPGVGPAADPKK